jgi:glycerol-3-phosphate O-acyltransferase
VRKDVAPPGWPVLVGTAIVGWVLARRRVLPEIRPSFRRLTHDAGVLEAIEEHSRKEGVPERVAMSLAERYAREIVPAFNARLYFRVGIPLAGWLSRALYRVTSAGEEGLATMDGNSSVVFAMNHRSNMDYVILAHLVADRAAVSFAAGEWARFWPLGPFVRAMGSFFVRRGSGDALYRRVLERYVRMAVESGLTLGVFLEGGLSRDGGLGEPKIGLLDYMPRGFDPAAGRDLVFMPVAFNYDWVLEDGSLLDTVSGRRQILSTAIFVARNLLFALRAGRRFGHAAVCFGTAISAREYARGVNFRALDREARIERVQSLARTLMQTIGEIVPAVPMPLIARVFVQIPEGLSGPEIADRVRALASDLEERGVYGSGLDHGAVGEGLRTLALRRIILEENGSYRVAPGGEELLRYYANSISHLFEPESASRSPAARLRPAERPSPDPYLPVCRERLDGFPGTR